MELGAEIARLVDSSRETANKVPGDFAHRGWIRLHGKGFVIAAAERPSPVRARLTHPCRRVPV